MKLFRITFCVVFLTAFLLLPGLVMAQEGIKLTITPPLIKNNVNPGQIWRSNIRLVNNNTFDIDIYVEVADFKGGGERGTVNFLPPVPESEGKDYLLSHWIKIDSGPIPIPAQESMDIPFTIVIPENAGPGGHYAAILAGTKSSKETIKGAAIKVSSLLASLIMLDVEGGIEEKGSIREFSMDKSFYSKPKAQFTVRFQNDGNVHIQPKGEIRIFDFWDKDAGVIKLNHKSDFGNVLPGDIRRWTLEWEGEDSFFSMGRYRAQLVLGYGNRGHETVDRAIYFWVIYTKPLLITLGSIFLFIFLLVFLIRRYIKKAVMITQAQAGIVPPLKNGKKQKIKVIHEGVGGTGLKIKKVKSVLEKKRTAPGYSWHRFKNIILIIIIILAILMLGVFYFSSGNNKIEEVKKEAPKEKGVEVIELDDYEIDDEATAADNEAVSDDISASIDFDITEDEKAATTTEELEPEAKELDKKDISIKVLNGGGTPGLAGQAAKKLEEAEYIIKETGNAITFNYELTIIRHGVGFKKTAGEISEALSLPAIIEQDKSQEEDIIVIIGQDF